MAATSLKMKHELRTATAADFKPGTVLICKTEGWEVCITKKCGDETWEARAIRGEKCVFEFEASCYWVQR